MKNLRIGKKLAALTAATIIAGSLYGCSLKELAPQENYDNISQTQYSNGEFLTTGITQELDVKGEDFKLIAEYQCNSDVNNPENATSWLITSDKELFLNVYTKNLPDGYKVYIDNIHIDTSLVAYTAAFNGIKQDEMDDRIHNSLLLGFYIDNNTSYFGDNLIEGTNEKFIQGSCTAYNGYSSTTISEKRFVESEYREYGVWGNKISIAYDLLIKGPNNEEYKNVTVSSHFTVEATPYEKKMANTFELDNMIESGTKSK